MTYQPVLPLSGYAGWALLNRTIAVQTAAFNKSPEITRDTDYFAANISKVTTAEDLVKDRRLLRVALGAFGLDDDINNKAFIQKVLSDGSLNADALARWSTRLGRHVTCVRITDGMHDLLLSTPPVRATVYAVMARWLDAYQECGAAN